MPMNSFYMNYTNFGGWWWQWCLLLLYVKYLNILINIGIICLILPVGNSLGCPVVRTQCFTAGAWIQSWSWYWDPTSHMAEKTNKQNLSVYFLKVYLLKIVWNDVIRNKIWITDTQKVIVPYLKITFIFWKEHINRIFDIHYIRWLLLFLLI